MVNVGGTGGHEDGAIPGGLAGGAGGAGEPTTGAHDWRTRRSVRWGARGIGGLVLYVAVSLVASFPQFEGMRRLPIGVGLFVVAGFLLLGPWARRRTDIPVGHLVVRRAFRWVLVALGVAALVWAAALATDTAHPRDAVLLPSSTNCGSALRPRRFAHSQLDSPTTGQSPIGASGDTFATVASRDCGDGIAFQRTQALGLAQVGLLLLWATLIRPLPTGAPNVPPAPEVEIAAGEPAVVTRYGSAGRRLVPHAWWLIGGAVVIALAFGAVVSGRTERGVRIAQSADRQTARWLAIYPPRIAGLTFTTGELAPALTARDYPTLSQRCQEAKIQADDLRGAVDALPSTMGAHVAETLRRFVTDDDQAFAACVTGSNRRDWAYLETKMLPPLHRAAAAAAELSDQGIDR
jgi:hypothetical protein